LAVFLQKEKTKTMAVAGRKKPDTEEVIQLDDGQIVNIVVKRGSLTQGDREANQEVMTNMSLANGRLEKLKQRSIEATSDGDFQRHAKEYKNFRDKIKAIQGQVDLFIITVISKWDMCLTEEDEKNGIAVPLTLEGLAQLEESLRLEVFLKLLGVVFGDHEEKKDLFENSSAAKQTPKEKSAVFPISPQDTSSPCDTDSPPNPSNAGA
jgi:hypothetical protein